MAVDNNKILAKMIHEAYQAKEQQHNEEKMLHHIANIKLLCELFLEEEAKEEPVKQEITEEERKMMLGEGRGKDPLSSKPLDEDDANGLSIFDF